MTNETTILVSSVTNAMRGKELLVRNGFSVQIQRFFHINDQNGCGYQLLVRGDGNRAKELLKTAGLRFKDGGEQP